jgi:hypothetical protein
LDISEGLFGASEAGAAKERDGRSADPATRAASRSAVPHMNGHATADVPWPKIAAALADPRFDLRSYGGLAVELHVDPDDIRNAVQRYRHEVRFSPVTTKDGRPLMALRSKPKNWRERISEIRHILASLGSEAAR